MSVPTTSIVILVRNGLELTRACVESIRRCTPEPYELVFVDNGSSDGTPDYLASLDDAFVITNDANVGFGAGCNQGIAASTGDRILLLNNDVVVTPGWLAALHRTLDESPTVGMAGPRSNRIVGVQQVDAIGYDPRSLDGLAAWATSWTQAHAGQRTRIGRLIGFCILMERSVVERIGGFDLRFGLGNFEDDDLCMRACVAGFTPTIAHDSFIHHHGSSTFTAERIDYLAAMRANFERFVQTWGIRPTEIDAHGSYDFPGVAARTAFDPVRHVASLVVAADTGATLAVGASRGTVVALGCERFDPDTTQSLLAHALRTWGPADDVTVLVRIDPRDRHAPSLLDAAADDIGDANLPDIVVVHADDSNDAPLLRAADRLLVGGRFAWARAHTAQRAGVAVEYVAGMHAAQHVLPDSSASTPTPRLAA